MLKLVGFGLLMPLLFSYIVEPFPQNFERPWGYEYKWPGNTSIVDYSYSPPLSPAWNAAELQKSLDALELSQLDARCPESTGIGGARANYSKAAEAHAQMAEFRDRGVLPYFMDIAPVCQEFGLFNCTCLVFGGVITCDVPYGKNLRYAIAMRLFSSDYSGAWEGTMDNALDDLEWRATALNLALEELEFAYGEADYAGICDDGVSGHEACANASMFFGALSANSGAAQYTAFKTIREALYADSWEVKKDVPQLRFKEVIDAFGCGNGGALGLVERLNSSLTDYLDKTVRDYGLLSTEYEVRTALAKRAENDADRNELWRINSGRPFGTIVVGGESTIQNQVAYGKLLLDLAERNMTASREAYARQDMGFLKDALVYASNAKALAGRSEEELRDAEADARSVADEYGNRARSSIAEVEMKFGSGPWPDRAAALYVSAKDSLAAGDSETRLGARFEDYANAALLAEEALNIRPDEQADTNWSAIASCTVAEGLMGKAEKDGIEVASERAFWKVLSRAKNATLLLDGCEQIRESIVEKARLEYGGLESERLEIELLLGTCGQDCDDLQGNMEGAERNLVAGGRVVYPDAIGSLAAIADTYLYVKNGCEDSIRMQLAKYISHSQNFFVERARLDQPSEARLEVTVVNNVAYAGWNIQVDVPINMEFGLEDVVYGAENLRGITYIDGKLRMYVKEINASQHEQYVFEKNSTVIRTVKNTQSAFGYEDGCVLVQERREVVSEIDANGFIIPEVAGAGDVYLDGVLIVDEDGFARNYVSWGEHTVELEYQVCDGYAQEIYWNWSSRVGNRIYHKYRMSVTPILDLELAQVFASIPPGSEVRERQAIALSGEKISAFEASDGLAITVRGLRADTPTRIEVSYYVDNSSEYAAEQIEVLEKTNTSENVQELAALAKDALARNDTAGAIDTIERAYVQLKKDQVALEKMEKSYVEHRAEIESEAQKIETALAPGADNALTDRLSARLEYLQRMLDRAGEKYAVRDLDGASREFEDYDGSWLRGQLEAFRKNASQEVNLLQGAYLDAGGAGIGVDGLFSSTRTSYTRFESSGALSDAYVLASQLDALRYGVNAMQVEQAAVLKDTVSSLAALATVVDENVKKYAAEYGEAKGTRLERYFDLVPDGVKTTLRQTDTLLKKKNLGISEVAAQFVELNKTSGKMDATLSYLKKAAENEYIQAQAAFELSSGKTSEKDRLEMKTLLVTITESLENEEWCKALKAGDSVLKKAAVLDGTTDYGSIVWISAAFILLVGGVYYWRGKIKLDGQGESRKRFRKLEKAV